MAILNVQIGQAGLAGTVDFSRPNITLPSFCYIETDDTLETITTTGYLNAAVQQGYQFSESMLAEVSTRDFEASPNVSVGLFGIKFDNGDYSLIAPSDPGIVQLPTIANHIAVYYNTLGGMTEDLETIVSGGNIQAGLSGTAGAFISYPETASTGYLKFYGSSNSSNSINVNVTNASHAQTSTYTIQDCGNATANFITSKNASSQSITDGNFGISNGTMSVGSTGFSGVMTVYAGASLGGLIFHSINAGGNYTTTIQNGTLGQNSHYIIPDIGESTGHFMVSTTGLRVKSVVNAALAGGGASNVVTDAFCTSSSYVRVVFTSQGYPTDLFSVTPGNGSFTVTTDLDPTASTISYIIIK